MDSASSRSSKGDTKATEKSSKPKSGERWLMTRKTWRYMSSKMAPSFHREPEGEHENVEVQVQRFQELCQEQTEFHIPDASAFSYSFLLQQSRDSTSAAAAAAAASALQQYGPEGAASIMLHDIETKMMQMSMHSHEEDTGITFRAREGGMGLRGREGKDFERREMMEEKMTSVVEESGFGTQTEDHLFFDLDLSEFRPCTSPPSTTEDKNAKPAAPVFSDAVLKYFGMGRKKSTTKPALDFRSVNYDRNLRNIKSKNIDVAMPEDLPKEPKTRDFQFQEGPSYIGYTQKAAGTTEVDSHRATSHPEQHAATSLTSTHSSFTTKTYNRSKSSTGLSAMATAGSSLPKAADYQEQFAKDDSHPVDQCERPQSLSLPLSPTSCAMHLGSTTGLNFQSFLSAVMHKSKSGGSLMGSSSHHHASGKGSEAVTPSGMQPTASSSGSSSSHTGRLLGKKSWKTRSKSQSRASASSTCIWTPQGFCTWTSITGRQVVLTDTTLTELTEVERVTLQKVALAKLQALNMGIVVRTPTGSSSSSAQKPKRRAYLLRKRAFSSGTFLDGSKKDSTDKESPNGGGQVFGIPIDQCVANERSARLQQQQQQHHQQHPQQSGINDDLSNDNGDSTPIFRKASHGSRTSFSSLIEGFKFDKGGSCESLNAEKNRRTSLSCSLTDVVQAGGGNDEDRHVLPLIPAIVTTCCSHLQTYGASKLGIFRVSSSKKRVRQLRESFDSGQEINLDEDCCPHDVATLLKEYFRDLPDPLLTRELYDAFVQTQRIRNRRLQMEALQHLVQLLPPANRDTLNCLLSFLSVVASKSNDHQNVDGVWESGNKMDSNNLATLFAPNLLHTIKPGTTTEKLAAESVARAGERIDVINVIRCMIDHHQDVFKVSAELLDEVYIHMMDTHPELLDRLLRRRCQNEDNNEDLDTSSSVFEGSDCSSLKIPWTPGYEDPVSAATYDVSTGFEHAASGQKWSQGTNTNAGLGNQSTVTEEHVQPHYRKRGDILHENGGTGGPRAGKSETVNKERRREPHRSTEEISQRLPDPNATKVVSAQRSVLCRERSDPTMSINSDKKSIGHQPAAAQKIVHPPRSSSDLALVPNGLELSDRRLSSPLVGSSGVITASLKISVGNATSPTLTGKSRSVSEGKSFTVDNEHEIPFIEDTPSLSSKSSSAASENKRDPAKTHPPLTRAGSSSSAWTERDESAGVAAGEAKQNNALVAEAAKKPEVAAGVVRSRTVSVMYGGLERNKPLTRSHFVVPASKEEWLKKDKQKTDAAALDRHGTSTSSAATPSTTAEENAASVKKKAKKKYVGGRNQTDSNLFTAMITSSEAPGDQPASSRHKVASVVHKRWNLIASTNSPGGSPSTHPDSYV